MCTSTTYAKFCTCGPDEIDPDCCWRLYREADGKMIYFVGSFLEPPAPPVVARLLAQKIEDDLNCHACFDFAYEPSDGDYLNIKLSGRDLWFLFLAGSGWSTSSSEGLPFGLHVHETSSAGRVILVEEFR